MDFEILLSSLKISVWMHYFWLALVVLGTLSILVVIHEWGHFIAARIHGVKVLEFSFGMGRKICSKKIGDTDYQVRWFPMGGFVKLHGEENLGKTDYIPSPSEFYGVSALKRLSIVLAGPVMNLFLAFVSFSIAIFFLGETLTKPKIGFLETSSAAYKAGLRSGDLILKVDGTPVESFEQVSDYIANKANEKILLEWRNSDQVMRKDLIPEQLVERDILGDSFLKGEIGLNPYILASIGKVAENTPASRLGLKSGDIITEMNGQKIIFWNELLEIVQKNPKKKMKVIWKHEGQVKEGFITPDERIVKGVTKDIPSQSLGVIGVSQAMDKTMIFNKKVSFFSSFSYSSLKLWELTHLTFNVFVKLFQGKLSKDSLMGPVRLAGVVSDVAQSGFWPWLLFLAFISHQLAFINLFPFPALDGGHAVFFFIELLMGRPVNLKIQEIFNRVGFTFLMLLFIFIIFNDLSNLIGSR